MALLVLRSVRIARPTLPAYDDKAFADTQEQASEKKNHHRDGGPAYRCHGQQIESARCSRDRKPCNHGELRPARIGLAAGPHAREDRGGELAARHQTYDRRVQAEPFMHMQWQNRHGHADNEERCEHRSNDRQQCCPPNLRRRSVACVTLVMLVHIHSNPDAPHMLPDEPPSIEKPIRGMSAAANN